MRVNNLIVGIIEIITLFNDSLLQFLTLDSDFQNIFHSNTVFDISAVNTVLPQPIISHSVTRRITGSKMGINIFSSRGEIGHKKRM